MKATQTHVLEPWPRPIASFKTDSCAPKLLKPPICGRGVPCAHPWNLEFEWEAVKVDEGVVLTYDFQVSKVAFTDPIFSENNLLRKR